ncbi:hypothetical protein C8Q75DRAFT_749641 [Abortiporus biennis]|nr:hypothetical protein C8Q75DRAFT_749641 [Abortiporus biennis]
MIEGCDHPLLNAFFNKFKALQTTAMLPAMPSPKSRPRKQTGPNTKHATSNNQGNSQGSMPPPPDPPPPQGILVPEISALSTCFRNTIVKTGQVYSFYADTSRLGIRRHAPYPPRALAATLGREIEKYDQLCDALESHLIRAITILKRDLKREEEKLKAATAPASSSSPIFQPPLPSDPSHDLPGDLNTGGSQQNRKASTSRRQSSALFSINRPPFPQKLDLSVVHNFTEDLTLTSAYPRSPVLLAPKSSIARTSDMLPHMGMELTIPEDAELALMQGTIPLTNSDPSLGSSAEKPIELDLDVDIDLFGENSISNPRPGDAPFPVGDIPPSDDVKPKEEERPMDLESLIRDANIGEAMDEKRATEILASLDGLPSDTQLHSNTATNIPLPSANEHSNNASGSSPSAILAGLQDTTTFNSSDPNFTFDMNLLDHPTDMEMNMEQLFNMNDVNNAPAA